MGVYLSSVIHFACENLHIFWFVHISLRSAVLISTCLSQFVHLILVFQAKPAPNLLKDAIIEHIEADVEV